MGYRLHVAKVHKIEMDYNGFANHMSERMNAFLFNLAEETANGEGCHADGEFVEYSEHISFEKGVWDKMINYVKNQPPIEDAFCDDEVSYSYGEVLEFMEYAKQNCDHDNEWIHLYWF